MEVVQLLKLGLGLAGGLSPQHSHPLCMTTKLEHSYNKQWFLGIHWYFVNRNFMNTGKTLNGKFLNGNRWSTDVTNKSVAQWWMWLDNGKIDWMNESQNMMSWACIDDVQIIQQLSCTKWCSKHTKWCHRGIKGWKQLQGTLRRFLQSLRLLI